MTLKLVRIIARGVDNLPTNFGVSSTFRFRLIGQHLSDASRDLATWTVCVPDSKFVDLYCVSISRRGDLDL